MSAHQGNSACRITVDPSTADVLRIETKKVLMFNHDPFEDYLEYIPPSSSRWPTSTATRRP